MCINFNSILSSFDKKGTLLKWLKEVEKKLPHSVLTSAAVEQVDATHIKIVFTYEDGTVVESESIALTSANAAYLNTVIKAGTDITITLNGEVLTVALNPSVRAAIQAAANTANTAKTMASTAQTAANNAQATADGKSTVIANPTLAGTEVNLTGISVNGTKYKVPTGGGGGTEVVGNPDVTGQSPVRLKDIKIGDEYFEITNGVFNLGNVGEFVSNSGGYISQADYSTLSRDNDLLIEVSTDEGNSAYFRYIGTTDTGNSLLYGCVHYGENIDDNENINMYIIIATQPYNQGYHWELTCINGYKLPIASASTLGGVKVGSGLNIASDGTLSATGGSGGTKLYRHYIQLKKEDNSTVNLNIYSTSSTGVTSTGQFNNLARSAIGFVQGNYTVVAHYITTSSIIIVYVNQNGEIIKSNYSSIISDTVTPL